MLSIFGENEASAYIGSVYSSSKVDGGKGLWLLFLDSLLESQRVSSCSDSRTSGCTCYNAGIWADCNADRKKADIDSCIIRLAGA